MSTPLVLAARAYLLSFEGVDDDLIDMHLHAWKAQRKNTLAEIYQSMLNHAKNRQSMPNTIGEIEKLRDVLFNFDARCVADAYPNHLAFLNEVKSRQIRTPSKIDTGNSRSHWVIYAKSVLSSARFLSVFTTAQTFHEFVESFYVNEYSRLALPLLLKEEIDGFGFALSCDFLKENGYSGFVKPDTHVNEICRAVGITCSSTDFGVFKDVVAYCDRHRLVPYEFDKLIWLIGSGNFYLLPKRFSTKKAEFIAMYLREQMHA